ncbi:MAG TPA: pyruvate, phosphate dikinase [Gaiellaceae bacterium]
MAVAASTRYIYDFEDHAPGGREQLGGKGIGLAEMTQLGLPVPAGFTVTTDACRDYLAHGEQVPDGLGEELVRAVARLEAKTGKRFGAADDPLLVSVRSGAAISMPGMMDSVLDLGLSDTAVEGLAATSGNPHFAYDSYRRLIQMYGEVVDGIDGDRFESALAGLKAELAVESDAELTADDLRRLVGTFKQIYRDALGRPFPQEALDQLRAAIEAVFRSWRNPRAEVYRRLNEIPDTIGTAVNVVQMVFGNSGDLSATGVAFTRDPATGERALRGEFLFDAQGEDVVAGIRAPRPLEQLRELMPDSYASFSAAMEALERHYRDVQDVEFTIDRGRLYILQTRSAKRTAASAVRAAVEMAREGLITRDEAVLRIPAASLDQLLHPSVDPAADVDVAATGVPASPGAAVGAVVFDPDVAAERGPHEAVILVRFDTTPDDIHGLAAAHGILTAHGGMASHAAVVARGMGKPCVAGCAALEIDERAGRCTLGEVEVREGDTITVDGSCGRVIVGAAPLTQPGLNPDLETILAWADEVRRLGVRANADTPADAERARRFGAEGIGLCRTEHMFFGDERLPVVQEMILADDEASRRSALDRLEPFQQSDFEAIFEAMRGLPVTIRLLDPPLHEFLPKEGEASGDRMRERIRSLREVNPMLGTRGCRLGLQWPGIYEMQLRAVARAAAAVAARTGEAPMVEIMHPLVAYAEELRRLRELTSSVFAAEAPEIAYHCGTMIELPRAALRAGDIAKYADFFSFGTNDLTQTTLGLSRDDAEGKFLATYLEQGVVEHNPFETLDQDGVGELVEIGVARGRAAKPDLQVGICGEHGGDPASIAFCERAGLDYVSCSPFRVPLARLAAAQAVLAERGTTYEAAGG